MHSAKHLRWTKPLKKSHRKQRRRVWLLKTYLATVDHQTAACQLNISEGGITSIDNPSTGEHTEPGEIKDGNQNGPLHLNTDKQKTLQSTDSSKNVSDKGNCKALPARPPTEKPAHVNTYGERSDIPGCAKTVKLERGAQ